MEIRNNHKAIGFGDSVIIKEAKDATLLNMLEENIGLQSRKLSNCQFRYDYLSRCEGKDGFYSGLLVDNEEKEALYSVDKLMRVNFERKTDTLAKDNRIVRSLRKNIASLSKTIEIKTPEEVAELLKLKTVDAVIKRFAK